MKEQSKRNIFKFCSSAAIVAALTAMFYYCLFFLYNKELVAPLDSGGYLMVALYICGVMGMYTIMGALKIEYNRPLSILLSHFISIVFINVLFYLQLSLIHRGFLPVRQTALLTLCQFFAVIIWTGVVFSVKKRFFTAKELLLVYGDSKAQQLVYKVLEREDQYRIVESVRYVPGIYDSEDNIELVKEKILRYKSVIIFRLDSSVRNDILKFCYEHDVEVFLPPRISDIIVRGAKEMNQLDSPLILCRSCSLSAQQRIIKRAFDVAASLTGIIILSPLMAVIAAAVKACDSGPVLFRQDRVTLGGRIFQIYKFRSMVVGAERGGEVIPAGENDPRITKVGAVLRKLRLDELPQLFNILKGDMSVVGPRPERVEHHLAYTEKIPEFPFRTKVKAGLTGYAQVMGKYNTSPYDKLLLDLEYIQNFSFFLDFKLIMLTVKIIFMKESAEGFKNMNREDKDDV